MAREQGKAGTSGQKTGTGGNRPKPQPSQSAKERSKAQSRPVSTKTPGRSGPAPRSNGGGPGRGGSGGGNRPRPGSRPPAPTPPRRISGALMAWGAVGIVIVIVVVLVLVKLTTSSSPNLSYTPVTAAPASVVSDVTTIPASVFNQVGVNAPSVDALTPPTVISGQSSLTLNGKSPSMLYYGAEYCPYCAAERWAMVAALSRFGTFSGLKTTASSHTDVDPQTHTFSFYGSTYTSPYINFVPIETYTNIPLAGGQGYKPLQQPTKEEEQAISTYSSSKYVPSNTNGEIAFPFIDINNRVLISSASFDPGILANLTWSEIASGLSDASNPATQAIVATANYITASICAVSPNAPKAVCDSPGVKAAAKALKLS
jgi:Domain of unknown function (DUF929)